MTLQKSIIFLLAIAVAPYDDYVSAWISEGSAFRPRLSNTNHNKHDKKIVTIYSSRLISLSTSSSRLAAIPKRRSDEDELDNFSNSFSRRSVLEASCILLPAAALTMPFPAYAQYGAGTSMALPNYIDYLIEKNTGRDDSKALYTGADPATVLKRLAESERRLGEIGELAEQKKWSQINGILMGPLGTLLSTMNQIVSIVSSSSSPSSKKTKQVQDAVKKVKADIFAIGQAADRKNAEGCTKQAEMASSDLLALLEIAFE